MSAHERHRIAEQLTRRCTNCFRELPGYHVNGTGWHWIDGNVGPFCDDCWVIITTWLGRHIQKLLEEAS